jgi:hypothetical protein
MFIVFTLNMQVYHDEELADFHMSAARWMIPKDAPHTSHIGIFNPRSTSNNRNFFLPVPEHHTAAVHHSTRIPSPQALYNPTTQSP